MDVKIGEETHARCSSTRLLASGDAESTKKKWSRSMFMALPAQICVLMMSHRHLEAI